MKKILIIIMGTIFMSCSSQQIDLEKDVLGVDVDNVYKSIKHLDYLERSWIIRLPTFETFEVEGFKFGTVRLTNGGYLDEVIKKGNYNKKEKEELSTELFNSHIRLFTRDTVSKKVEGIYFSITKESEIKGITEYVNKVYGKGLKMQWEEENEAFLWKNYKKDYILVLQNFKGGIYDKTTLNNTNGDVLYEGVIPELSIYIINKKILPFVPNPLEPCAISLIRSLSRNKIKKID